jgi:hypothetical protein
MKYYENFNRDDVNDHNLKNTRDRLDSKIKTYFDCLCEKCIKCDENSP